MKEITAFLFFCAEQHDALKDLIHDLDIWHKSAKLVKALTDVINARVYRPGEGYANYFGILGWQGEGCKLCYK